MLPEIGGVYGFEHWQSGNLHLFLSQTGTYLGCGNARVAAKQITANRTVFILIQILL